MEDTICSHLVVFLDHGDLFGHHRARRRVILGRVVGSVVIVVMLLWPRALEVRARRVGLSRVIVGRRAVHLGLGLALVHTQFLFELRLGEVRRRGGVRLDVALILFAEQRL